MQLNENKLRALVETFETPLFVYDALEMEQNFNELSNALHLKCYDICYAVKANSNLSVINLLADLGSGADVVSSGELRRALLAGVPASKIVFSGVGKTEKEITAALEAKVGLISVESLAELKVISQVSKQLGLAAPVSLRLNLDIDAGSHEYISTGASHNKFGISSDEQEQCFVQLEKSGDSLKLEGLSIHIGSQITQLSRLEQAICELRSIFHTLAKKFPTLSTLDIGGGLGVNYPGETAPSLAEYGNMVSQVLENFSGRVVLEPGRSLVAMAGILLTQVIRSKQSGDKTFVIVDAGMNDLIRPALYGAKHEICALVPESRRHLKNVDIVGPICESGDFFLKDTSFPEVHSGDLLAIQGCGAYASSMSSQYNSHPRAAELLLDQTGNHRLIRSRESFEDLLHSERQYLSKA